jgi:TetR/AcrR family transcriptional regulator, fatty acid metabolism regulator protein
MKGELRKNQILDGATKLFARNGYYETHVEDILREVKIGKGTFYLYFKNKEDLFISILERFLDEWEKVVLIITADQGPKDLGTYFREEIARSLLFFKQNEYLCNIYLRIAPGISEFSKQYIEKFEQRMLNYVSDEIQKGVQAGFFRRDLNVEITANIIAGAHLRLAYYYFILKKRRRDKPSIDQISDELFKMISKGLSL